MEVFNLYQAVWRLITGLNGFLTVAGQSVEHLTAEWEVAGSIPVTGHVHEKWRYSLCSASGLTFPWLG